MDEDPFGFQIEGQSKPGYGGSQLSSSGKDMDPWKILSGWFGYDEKNRGSGESSVLASQLPKTFSVSQNYPNPFNPSTTIQYDIPQGESPTPVDINIYDLRGRLVRKLVDEDKTPGRYQVHWDGRNDRGQKVSSGVYLYRIEAGDFISTRKMIMVR